MQTCGTCGMPMAGHSHDYCASGGVLRVFEMDYPFGMTLRDYFAAKAMQGCKDGSASTAFLICRD